MSQKKQEKKKPMLPIIVETEKSQEIPKGLNLYLCSFTWQPKIFVNIETGRKSKIKFWTFGGLAFLNPALRSGRNIVIHEKIPKHITNQKGEIVETKIVNRSRSIGKAYGFEALASTLSAIYPCSTEGAKALVGEAISKNLRHAKIVLRSDLIPTSPQRFEGKNEWVILADYPSTDTLEKKINEVLKAQGSPLRARFGLKWRLQE
jgi:hypothetical protein